MSKKISLFYVMYVLIVSNKSTYVVWNDKTEQANYLCFRMLKQRQKSSKLEEYNGFWKYIPIHNN